MNTPFLSFTKNASAEEVWSIYEVAEHLKVADKEKDRTDRALGSAMVAGAAGVGGRALGKNMQGALVRRAIDSIYGGREETGSEARAFQSHIAKEVPDLRMHSNTRDMAADMAGTLKKKGLPIGGATKMHARIAGAGPLSFRISPNSGIAYSPHSAHPSIKAHEIGHIGGMGKSPGLLRKMLGAAGAKVAPGAALLASVGGAGYAGAGKTKEERNTRFRHAQGATALAGGLALPNLFEEARASKRAVEIGRKTGKGMEYAKHLLPAWGTYAAKPIAATAAGLGALELLRRRSLKMKD